MTKKTKTYTPVYLMSEEEDIEQDPSKNHKESISIGSNQVLFYDDVTRQSIYTLNRQLDTTSKSIQLLGIHYSLPVLPPIQLFINSEGGEVFSAFSSVDRITSSVVPVHSYVEGFCASAATLLSVCCHRRYIRKNGFMMIHQLSGGVWGSFETIKEESENMELLMKCIKRIYLQHTKIPENDLIEILKHDTYLDAEECLKYGLVDEIV
jgi:ATP-dependent protease ClpP protease subunit